MGSRKERILNYGRIFSDYKEELELALIQNCAVECELYSIVASVLRESESGTFQKDEQPLNPLI